MTRVYEIFYAIHFIAENSNYPFFASVTEYSSDSIPVGVPIERVHATSDETNLIITYEDAKGVHLGAISTSILSSQVGKALFVWYDPPLRGNSSVLMSAIVGQIMNGSMSAYLFFRH